MRLKDTGLPDYLYKVKIPAVATYSEEEIDTFGMPVTVMDGKKKDDYEADTVVMLTLDKIVDIYISGYSIVLLNDFEVTKLYGVLEDYLSKLDVRRESLNQLPMRDARADDIELFLTEMFGYNKSAIVKDALGTGSGFNLGMGVMNRNGPMIGTIGKEPRVVSSGIGIMSNYDVGYKNQPVINNNNVSYITDESPVIDLSKIKRTSKPRQRQGVRYKEDD